MLEKHYKPSILSEPLLVLALFDSPRMVCIKMQINIFTRVKLANTALVVRRHLFKCGNSALTNCTVPFFEKEALSFEMYEFINTYYIAKTSIA